MTDKEKLNEIIQNHEEATRWWSAGRAYAALPYKDYPEVRLNEAFQIAGKAIADRVYLLKLLANRPKKDTKE